MRGIAGIVISIAATAAVAFGQQPVDPPGRVARLNYISGAVSFRPGDVDDWVEAVINRPLTTGDHIWTDDGGAAEMHIGSNALRLGQRTAFEFLNLNDDITQIRLTDGTLIVRLRYLGENESFEIDTPNMAFSLLRPGEYRVDVDSQSQASMVTVRTGEGEVTGSGQAFPVHAGEQARIAGEEQITYDVHGVPRPDGLDQWSVERDRWEDQVQSVRYVPPTMTGYEDLDAYGDWRDVPGYGPCWRPRAVPTGWAPYRWGHWVFIAPWGWTWVDDEPWGFAPFHYGRWALAAGSWVWVPGPVHERPVYAPALVAWVGGPHFSVGVSIGGPAVAWFPLAPREVFVPSYHVSPAYVQRVNVTNTVVNNINVTNVYNNTTVVKYVNASAPNAVTAVPQSALARPQSVYRAAIPVRAQEIAQAQVVTAAPVAPTQASVLGRAAETAGSAPRPPAALLARPVVAKATPPPPPVPFRVAAPVLQQNPGRPLDPGTANRLRQQAAVAPPPVRPAVAAGRPAMQTAPPARPAAPIASPAPPAAVRPNNQAPQTMRPAPSMPSTQAAPPQQHFPNDRPAPQAQRPPVQYQRPVAPPTQAAPAPQHPPKPPAPAPAPQAHPPATASQPRNDRPPAAHNERQAKEEKPPAKEQKQEHPDR